MCRCRFGPGAVTSDEAKRRQSGNTRRSGTASVSRRRQSVLDNRLDIAPGPGRPETARWPCADARHAGPVARVLAGRGVALTRPPSFSIRRCATCCPIRLYADRHAKKPRSGLPRRSAAGSASRSSATTMSTAPPLRRCLTRFLAHFGVKAAIYIPDRIFEGYGPNPEAMRELVDAARS